jgi:ketosteroid isomerase-like protein
MESSETRQHGAAVHALVSESWCEHDGVVALTMDQLASQVRMALAAEDLSAFADLLHPDVTWGAPGTNPGCKNRNQVLVWYQRGRDAGVHGSVYDVEIMGDRLLVSMSVRGTEGAREGGEAALRYQVLTVQDGKVADIVGFDDKAEALAYNAKSRNVSTPF